MQFVLRRVTFKPLFAYPNISLLCLMTRPASTNKNYLITGFAFAIMATVLWSGNFIVARALHQRITPVSLAFLRWLAATVLLFPIAYKNLRREWRSLLPHLKNICLTALTGVTLFNTFIYIAGHYSSAINLALIGTTAAPVFVLLIAALFLKQKLFLNQIAGAALCITGIVLLITNGNTAQLSRLHFSIGDFWILAAALSFAIYTILVRKKPQEVSSTSFLFSVFFLGTVFLLPAFLIEQANGRTFVWDKTLVSVLLYLGAGASVAAFLLWNLSIRRIGPARTALFGNLIPVFSSIEATLILNEKLNRLALISLLIILAGIVLANVRQLAKK